MHTKSEDELVPPMWFKIYVLRPFLNKVGVFKTLQNRFGVAISIH